MSDDDNVIKGDFPSFFVIDDYPEYMSKINRENNMTKFKKLVDDKGNTFYLHLCCIESITSTIICRATTVEIGMDSGAYYGLAFDSEERAQTFIEELLKELEEV